MERPDPERELIERAGSGAPEAFAEIVRAHQAAVRGFVSRYLRRRDAVDDLAQEVFLAVHRSLATYRGEAPFRLWILGVARRQVALYLRREMKRAGHEQVGLAEAVARWQADRVEAAGSRLGDLDREVFALDACLQSLPPESSELVAAHYFRRESSVDIAQRLGKKETAIRMALLRIRNALRGCIEQRLHSRPA